MANNKSSEKELARALYLYTQTTQKQIAQRVGVQEKTISAWVKEGGWESLRDAMHVGIPEMLRNLHDQYRELQECIKSRPPGERFPTTGEANIQNLLLRGIKQLGSENSLSTYVQIGVELEDWVRGQRQLDDDFVKKFGDVIAEFLALRSKKGGAADA